MSFEAFAVVELMGHGRIAGKCSEESIAGVAHLRVDVPKTDRRPAFTKYFSASAIYSITPTDETTATYAAETFNTPPVPSHILWMPDSPRLAEKVVTEEELAWESDDNSPSQTYDGEFKIAYDEDQF